MSGQVTIFGEALNPEKTLVRHLGESSWGSLSERQRGELRTFVRDRFLRTLAPPRGSAGGIAWSSARASGETTLDADVGLRLGERTLKTRWILERHPGGWRVTDVRLSDPGISLADSAVRSLGAAPLRRRDRGRQARAEILPRLLGLFAIAAVVLAVRRRLSGARRTILYWTAAAPAVLFAVDGALAARRAYSETYALTGNAPRERWREAEEKALAEDGRGNLAEANEAWATALALGAPPGPTFYRVGLLARERGALVEARELFERALAQREPAPGAARELAADRLSQRRDAEARALLERYVAAAGPDPETLWLLAVAESNLGRHGASAQAMRAARAMLGDSTEGAELEARVRARAGDARGAVDALRRLEPQDWVDRFALRADQPKCTPIGFRCFFLAIAG
jgi:tetratricopeptide (TPR) repeat protein